MVSEEMKTQMEEAIFNGNGDVVKDLVTQAIQDGAGPLQLISDVLNPAISKVGDQFDVGRMFLPELIMASEALDEAMKFLLPEIRKRGEEAVSQGKVVIATAQGDIHDIGKNIVSALMKANGFDVYDLGRDVPAQDMIAKAEEVDADVIGMSALLTTTIPYCQDTVKLLADKGLGDKYHVVLGGGAANPSIAERIGCKYNGEHAAASITMIKNLLGGN